MPLKEVKKKRKKLTDSNSYFTFREMFVFKESVFGGRI